MSMMSFAGAILYACLALSCLAAALVARKYRDRPLDAPFWAGAAIVLLSLAAMRVVGGEDKLRGWLRELIQTTGNYGDRLSLQVPLAIVVLLAAIGLAWLFARKWHRARRQSRARLVLAAGFGLLALALLYGLRLVSLHQTDWLLYSGPVRLNWILEGLIGLWIGTTACIFAWSKRPRVRPGREPPDRP